MDLAGIEPASVMKVSVYKARRQAPQSASQVKGNGLHLFVGEARLINGLA